MTVQSLRGPEVETEHTICAAVAARDGLVHAWGDPMRRIYARSAIKPFAALVLPLSGTDAALGLSAAELALACGSHHGEAFHLDAVACWLGRAGYGIDALQCGIMPPLSAEVRARCAFAKVPFTALHNNSSGRHAGLLSICTALGFDPTSYTDPRHPTWAMVLEVLHGEFGLAPTGAVVAQERCGLPTFAVTLAALAVAAGRLAANSSPGACRITSAMRDHPKMIGGTHALTTAVTAITGGRLLVKGGSEGVMVGIHRASGHGLALKAVAGSDRAAGFAFVAAAERLGWLSGHEADAARTVLGVENFGTCGRVTGRMHTVVPGDEVGRPYQPAEEASCADIA